MEYKVNAFRVDATANSVMLRPPTAASLNNRAHSSCCSRGNLFLMRPRPTKGPLERPGQHQNGR